MNRDTRLPCAGWGNSFMPYPPMTLMPKAMAVWWGAGPYEAMVEEPLLDWLAPFLTVEEQGAAGLTPGGAS